MNDSILLLDFIKLKINWHLFLMNSCTETFVLYVINQYIDQWSSTQLMQELSNK